MGGGGGGPAGPGQYEGSFDWEPGLLDTTRGEEGTLAGLLGLGERLLCATGTARPGGGDMGVMLQGLSGRKGT